MARFFLRLITFLAVPISVAVFHQFFVEPLIREYIAESEFAAEVIIEVGEHVLTRQRIVPAIALLIDAGVMMISSWVFWWRGIFRR